MPGKASARHDDRTPVGQLTEAGLHGVLGYQLAQAAIVANAVFAHEVGEPEAMRPVEFTLLALIAQNPGVPAARLAKALAVTKPNITMWMDRLVGRGLVERRPSSTDGRSLELHTTPAGAALAATCMARLLDAEGKAFDILSSAERAMLLELLHKIARRRGHGL